MTINKSNFWRTTWMDKFKELLIKKKNHSINSKAIKLLNISM